ncbi:MAG: hypothetical protein ACXVCY_07345 [Pseudobdellovibrionaceae bacterium]
MNKFFALSMALCLILGFQNCSKSPLQNSEILSNSKNGVTVSVPVQNGGISSAKITYIEIPNADSAAQTSLAQKSLDVSSSPSSNPSSSHLVISVQTGVIQLMDASSAVLEERCLSPASLSELNTILSGASICNGQAVSADICGMRYKPAYASLYADEGRVNLGEEKDSCGTGKKDLCGDMAGVFQNYVSFVKAHFQEMNCQ